MTTFDVSRPSDLKVLLGQHGFQFKKQLGQNFLIDSRILDAIVEAAEIGTADGAFEIGPGAGVVTQRLARAAKQVVAVEKDRSLAPILEASLEGQSHVDIVYGDVLNESLEALWGRFTGCQRVSVVANLPYYVTTPILFHLLESKVPIHNIVVMVQREVADRMMAPPGGKDYGALSVSVQYHAVVDRVTKVPPSAFIPPPNVESTVVRLRVRTEPPVHLHDEAYFFKVVRAAFSMRRKTLLNTLSQGLNLPKATVSELLDEVGISPQLRGETLSLEAFGSISNACVKFQQKGT